MCQPVLHESESNQIAVDQFLDILAEVALAVATRQTIQDSPHGE